MPTRSLMRMHLYILHVSCRVVCCHIGLMAESLGESTFNSSRSSTPSTSESGVGRPKRSPVWQHFVFDNVTGKSAC